MGGDATLGGGGMVTDEGPARDGVEISAASP